MGTWTAIIGVVAFAALGLATVNFLGIDLSSNA